MFNPLVNELHLRCTVTVDGPVLIRSGLETGLDPTRPDMEFVRTGQQVYLPGSSLKGAFRAWSERLLRSENADYACNPVTTRACAITGNLKGIKQATEGYRRSCRACTLFGSTVLRGRVAFADAMPVPGTVVTAQRNHVLINRLTGGAQSRALFNPEVVEAGAFILSVTLTNYALWQAALIVQALQDMDDGYLTIGGGAGKGFGRLRLLPEPEHGERFTVRWRDWRRTEPDGWRGRENGDGVDLDSVRWERRAGWEAEAAGAGAWDLLRRSLPGWALLLGADRPKEGVHA